MPIFRNRHNMDQDGGFTGNNRRWRRVSRRSAPPAGAIEEEDVPMSQNPNQQGNQPNKNPGQDRQQEQQDDAKRRQPGQDADDRQQAGNEDKNRQNR